METNRMPGTTRLSINISAETAESLNRLATKKDTHVTNIVRRAVSVYYYLWKAEQDNKTLRLYNRRRRWWGYEITTEDLKLL